jgi:hypothetical protein
MAYSYYSGNSNLRVFESRELRRIFGPRRG